MVGSGFQFLVGLGGLSWRRLISLIFLFIRGHQDVSVFEIELLVAMYEEGDSMVCGEMCDLQDGQG